MKKLNIQVYQGDPSGLVTKDNNNLFIEGDVQYSTGTGTIVKSVTSIKNSNGEEIMSGGGDIDPDVAELLEEHPEIKASSQFGCLMSYSDITSDMSQEYLEEAFSVTMATDGVIDDGVYLTSGMPPIENPLDANTFYNSYTFKPGVALNCIGEKGVLKGTITFTTEETVNDLQTVSRSAYGELKLIPASSFTFDPVIG